MAGPITWQNVNQGDASTAWRAMDSAQKSFNGSFDGLTNILKSRESVDASNVVVQGKNNTNSYLNQVAELGKTPEMLQKAITDGSLDKLRASFGPNIDHNATRGAAETMLNDRYAQAKAGIEYGNMSADARDAQVRDQISGLTAQGKTGEAQALLDNHQNMRNKADLYKGFDARTQEELLRSRAGVAHDQSVKQFGYNRENQLHGQKIADGQLNVSQGQLGVARQNASINAAGVDIQRDEMKMRQQDRLNDNEIKAVEGLSKADSNTAGSEAGSAALFKDIESTFKGDPNGASNARAAMAEVLDKYPGISTGAARLAVLSQDGSRYLKNDSWVRNNTVERAGVFQGTPEETLRALSADSRRTAARDLYDRAHKAAVNGPYGAGENATRKGTDRLAAAAAEAKAKATTTPAATAPPVTAMASETANTMALKGLEPAITQTVKAIQAADAAGDVKEVQRLSAIMAEQNQARARAMGLK